MADVNIPLGRREFISKFRETLPDNLRFLDDEDTFNLASRARPYIRTAQFKPEEEDPGFIGAIGKEAELAYKRIPEQGAALFSMIATKNEDPDSPAYKRVDKFATDLYKAARSSAEQSMANDPDLQKYVTWAGNNPFTWGKFFTDPSVFGRVAANSLISMGQIMTAGVVGTAIGGPVIGAMAAGSMGFALEGSEAYSEAFRRAEEKGLSPEEISNVARESGLTYGAWASVLESIVPLSMIRSMGLGHRVLGKNFSRYSAKYLDNIADKVPTKKAMFNAMRDLTKDNLSITKKITDMGRYMGKNAIMEAATEATQYLTQEAILDGKIDGRAIDEAWLKEKMNDPEFHESIAGGLVGGGVMSGPAGISRYKGTIGKQAAQHAQLMKGKQKEKYVEYILKSNELTYNDKVEFSKSMIAVEGEILAKPLKEQVVTETPIEAPVSPKVTEPVKKQPVKKTTEPPSPAPEGKPPVSDFPGQTQQEGPSEPEFPGRVKKEPDLIGKAPVGTAPSEHVLNTLLGLSNQDFEKVAVAKTDAGKVVIAQAGLAISANEGIKETPTEPGEILNVLRRLRKEGAQVTKTKGVTDLSGTEVKTGVKKVKPKVVPKKGVSIPLVITNADRVQLKRLGWNPTQIKRFTPAEAKEAITKRVSPPAPVDQLVKGPVEDKMAAMEAKALALQAEEKAKPFSEESVPKTVKPVETKPVSAPKVTEKTPSVITINTFEGPTTYTVKEAQRLLAEDKLEDIEADAVKQKLESIGVISKPVETPSASGQNATDMTDDEVDAYMKPVFYKPSLIRKHKAKRLGWVGDTGSSKSMLTSVAKNGTRTQSLVAKYLSMHLDQDVAVRWGPNDKKSSVYQHGVGKQGELIHGIFMYPDISSRDFTDTFLHELVHAITVGRLDSSLSDKQSTVLEELRRNALRTSGLNLEMARADSMFYGLVNVKEFVSEALTNKDFQEWLDTIPSTVGTRSESIWEAIKRIIFKILGIPATSGSTLSEALTQIIELIEDIPEQKTGDIEYYRMANDEPHFDEAMHPEREGDEEGEDRYVSSGREVDPSMFADRFLNANYGIYIDKNKTYPKMVKIAKDYRDKNIGHKPTFYEFEAEIRKLLQRDSLTKITVDPTGPKFQDALKEWYQRVNSRIEVSLAIKTPSGAIQHDETPSKRKRQAINLDGGQFTVDDLLNESPANGAKEASTEVQNFVEESQSKGLKLIYISAKQHIFKHIFWKKNGVDQDGWVQARGGDFTINGKQINAMNRKFASDYLTAIKNGKKIALKFFLADTSGDNAQIVLAAISPFSPLVGGNAETRTAGTGMTRESYEAWIAQEVADENIDPKTHAKQLLESADKYATNNPLIYSQMAGLHHRMKQIKGRRYLKREKNIADTWKRLKIDLSKGWVPRGMGPSKIMYVNTAERNISFEIADQDGNVQDISAMYSGKYRNDGWLMTSQDYFDRFYKVSGVRTKVMKSVMRHLDTENLEDYIAIKMSEMTPFEGTKVYEKTKSNVILHSFITRDMLQAKPNEFWLFGDNTQRSGFGGQAKEMRGEPNAIGIPTKKAPSMAEGSFFTDAEYEQNIQVINSAFAKLPYGAVIHMPADGLGTGRAQLKERAPRTYEYLQNKIIQFTEPGISKLIAKYENGKWRNDKDEVFDKFGTRDEIKDTDGIYNQDGVIHTLPEEATRVLYTTDSSTGIAAHPVLGHELALTTKFMADNPEAQAYLKAVKKHYTDTAEKYLNKLYSFRDDPKALRDFIYRDLQKGELPTEIQQIIEMFPNGQGLMIQNILRQVIPMLNHRFFNNGLFKMRQLDKGLATKVAIKPRGGLNISKGSIMVSSDNETIRNLLSEASGMDTTEGINSWLEGNDYWVLVHRQPIQGFTKVQPRKIQRLVDGHGEAAFLTEEDVFRLHEADHDGDTVFIEKVPDELVQTLNKLIETDAYKKRNRTIFLEMFQKGNLGGSLANYEERLNLLEKNSRLVASQGNVVNAKTMLHTLSYKGVKFMLGNVAVSLNNPEDKVTLDYWPLDTEILNQKVDTPYGEMTMKQLILKEGDEIIQEKEGVQYLRTTKENEFSLLLQAAVDNEKFGLMNKIKFIDAGNQDIGLNGWLITRIFNRASGKWTGGQINILRKIYNHFNYSQDRQGITEDRNVRNIAKNIERSKEVAGQYYDTATNSPRTAEASNNIIFNNIQRELKDASQISDFTTSATNQDLRMTPSEILIGAPGAKDIVDEANMSDRGVSMVNPLLMTVEGYYFAHAQAMQDIEPFFDEIEQAKSDPKLEKQISDGMDLGLKMGQAYYKQVFEDTKADKKRKGFTEEQLENKIVKPEYNEAAQEFMSEYIPQYNKLSDVGKKYSTAVFLSGVRSIDPQAKNEKVDRVLSLLPVYLLHKPTLFEYGKAYAKYLYKPNRSRMKGSDFIYAKLTEKFAVIKQLEAKRCG